MHFKPDPLGSVFLLAEGRAFILVDSRRGPFAVRLEAGQAVLYKASFICFISNVLPLLRHTKINGPVLSLGSYGVFVTSVL